jgi:hypothetical protein
VTLMTCVVLATTWAAGPKCEGLFELVEHGDTTALRERLRADTVDTLGTGLCARRTPLLFAAELGKLDTVKVLLELGADVGFTVVERDGLMAGRVTAECLARSNGHDAVAKLLRTKGAKDSVDGCRRRALTTAALKEKSPSKLAKERKAGNRLSLAQLEEVLPTVDCDHGPELCVELVRHLPTTPSEARDRVLSFFEDWAQAVPGLQTEVDRLRRTQ